MHMSSGDHGGFESTKMGLSGNYNLLNIDSGNID